MTSGTLVMYQCVKEKIGQECQKDGEFVYILTKGQAPTSGEEQQISHVLQDACVDTNSIKTISG